MIGVDRSLSHSPDELSDAELLATATGDPDSPEARGAASRLLARYRDQVYQWCYRYAREHEGALDLAQDVLVRAYRKLSTFEGRSRFSSWLFMVTRTTCLNAIQRPRLDVDPEFDLERVVDGSPAPDTDVLRDAELEEMRSVMEDALDPQEQEAMVLRYFEALPPEEITSILGLEGRSGARGLLQRARRKLAREVARRREGGDADG